MRISKLVGLMGLAAAGMAVGDGRAATTPEPDDQTWGSKTLNVDPDLCAGPRFTAIPRETTRRRRRWSTARS